jgi:ABC-2 type transport system ATP-binding protein
VTINGLDALTPQVLLLIVPLVLLQLGLLVLAVVDLLRDDRRVRGGNKGVWAVVIVFVSMIGPILYFLVGREEGPVEPSEPGPGAMPGWGSPHDPPLVRRPDGTPRPEAVAGEPDGRARAWSPSAVAPMAATAPPAITPVAPPAAPAREGASAGPTRAAPASASVPAAGTSAPEGQPAIRVEGLTKRYPGGVLALDRLTMAVPAGSVFGLLGPNGAGKTTCLRLLAGLTRPTGGRATVASIPVETDGLAVRSRLGYLEQDPRAYGWMTGREQLRMLGRLHGLDGMPMERAISDALARVDLADAADRRASTYSGGMRQRLGIAGALVHRPPVVILDEPVSALDPEGRRDVLNLIVDLRGETTVLFSTHVLADVERICDRVGILAHGRLVVEGPLAELLDRYALPVYRVEAEPGQAAALDALAARLHAMPWVTGIGLEHGLLTVAVSDPGRAGRELLSAITAEGITVLSVARARPTLEDVFLRLTAAPPEVAA